MRMCKYVSNGVERRDRTRPMDGKLMRFIACLLGTMGLFTYGVVARSFPAPIDVNTDRISTSTSGAVKSESRRLENYPFSFLRRGREGGYRVMGCAYASPSLTNVQRSET